MSRQKFKQLLKKSLLFSGVGSGVLAVGIALDMIIGGSVYHPLTHAYKTLSWIGCKNSQVYYCDNDPAKAAPIAVSGSNGVVVTSQHNASEIGLKILKQGGNAIDAAVAVGYALAVTDPCCGNIGGGGFMLVRLANGKDTFINFREKAPLAASKNMYLDKQGKVIPNLSTKGYLAVGVPGTVKGLELALTSYGTMPRDRVMAPAIELAAKGFSLQTGDIQVLKGSTKKFQSSPNVANIFLKNGKDGLAVGDRLVQTDLANTLQQISDRGADAFYNGTIAQEVVKVSRQNKGILTQQDFANYTVSQIPPLRCSYRGYEVIAAPPPGGGATLCQMLNILEGYKLKKGDLHYPNRLHLMLSAMLYGYADRNNSLGDPDFVKNPVEKLVSKDYAAQLRARIPQARAIPPEPLYSVTSQEGTNTTHYSIVDRDGNAVAVTYTINSHYGAGVIAGKTGFFLNNEMDDFTSKPGVANSFGLVQGKANIIEPGKRPLSSMSPTIVMKNGKVLMVTGSPGGSTITTTVLQMITNVIDRDMDIARAVNAPRIHYQGLPNVVLTEPFALKSSDVQDLWSMGYRVAPFVAWGAAESILVDPQTGLMSGANDKRLGAGLAVAY
jgi:gamma-glutamyltranspeptidase / glutathione hydrolase